MAETTYSWGVVGLLFVSGLCHIAAPVLAERWMSRAPVVRGVGMLLLVLAIPCLVWRGWYFWTLFVGLTVSGLWRLLFPQSSIRATAELSALGAWVSARRRSNPGVGITAVATAGRR